MKVEPFEGIDLVDEDAHEHHVCPHCQGQPIFLGMLGSHMWLRCRACFFEWSEES